MHLSLDSSVEHASSMDLQPSTKEIWISYQNWLRCRAHCSYFNSLILSDFRLASQGAVCICFCFFFFLLAKNKTKQQKTTKNHNIHILRGPVERLDMLTRFFFFCQHELPLPKPLLYSKQVVSAHTHTHTFSCTGMSSEKSGEKTL